ncbi:MAG: substrate-binding domain-containing protein [Devosia sp.]
MGGIKMHNHTKRFAAPTLVAACSIIALLAVTSAAQAQPKPPTTTDLEWGTFTLSPAIAERVTSGQPLRVVLSMEGPAIPVFGPQYMFGFGEGVKVAEKLSGVPIEGKFIGPTPPNMNEQIAQVRSLAAANQLDCLSLEGGGAPTWIPIIKDLTDKGIPVFTVGEDIEGSQRLGTFHTDWALEGRMAAGAVVEYFKANNIELKSLALASSVPDQPFARTRMTAFRDEIKALVPTATFENEPANAINGTFDPAATYSAIKAFLTGHAAVQVVYHTDINSGVVDKIITDTGAKGKMFAIGHNVSDEVLAAIKSGVQIGTIDQNYPSQSEWAATVCSTYLTTGDILPNTNEPVLVTAANADESLANLKLTTGR